MSITREEERKRRLALLAAKLKDDGESSLDRTLGWGGMKWGCRIERVREYLEVLRFAGLIELDEKKDTIWWLR